MGRVLTAGIIVGLILMLLCSTLQVFTSQVEAEASETYEFYCDWVSVTPIIDGYIHEDEWLDAYKKHIYLHYESESGPSIEYYVYLKNDENFLYIGADGPDDNVDDPALIGRMAFGFDVDNDNKLTEWKDTYYTFDRYTLNPRHTVWDGSTWLTHCQINDPIEMASAFSGSPNLASSHWMYELKIPLQEMEGIKTDPGQTVGFGLNKEVYHSEWYLYCCPPIDVDSWADLTLAAPLTTQELYPLPAGCKNIDPSNIVLDETRLLINIDIAGFGQIAYVEPGETVSCSYTYQIYSGAGNPSEINQGFFIMSWTPSWPAPSGYYIPVWNGVSGVYPGVTNTESFSFTAPSTSGTYYLYWCGGSEYNMEDAVSRYSEPLTLPAHAKIIVTAEGYEWEVDKSVWNVDIQVEGTTYNEHIFTWIRLGADADLRKADWADCWLIQEQDAYDIRIRDLTFNGELTINQIIRNSSGTYVYFKRAPYSWQGIIRRGQPHSEQITYKTKSLSTLQQNQWTVRLSKGIKGMRARYAPTELPPTSVEINFILPKNSTLISANAPGLSPSYSSADGRTVVVFKFYNEYFSDHSPYEVKFVVVPAIPDFEISVSPSSRTINPGQSTTYTVTVTSINGFSSEVSLDGSITPSSDYISLKFNPESVIPPSDGSEQSTLTVSTTSTVTPDSYTLTITGASEGKTHSAAITMIVRKRPNQPPIAYINEISPSPATQGESVSFSGHGTDPDGSIVAYEWRSSIDGFLKDSKSFRTSELSEGDHTIYFKVKDNDGAWSTETTETLTITPAEVDVIITSYLPPSGWFVAGNRVSAKVAVKNTGHVRWTFYIGFSVKDATEAGRWWDAPFKTITLDSGASDTVTLEWIVSMSAPAGRYDAKVAVWKSKAGGVLKNMLDTKEKSNAFKIVPDGFDYDALEWINVVEARDLISEEEDMSEITIAIIDTGIDSDIWEFIESRGGDIILYVRPERYWDWLSFSWKWRYLTANNPNDPIVRDSNLIGPHGSAVTSVIWQISPKVKLIIFSMRPELFGGALLSERVERSLQWIIDHMHEYDVDIVSMSLKLDNYEIIEDEIQKLYNNFDVLLFAGAGNRDAEEYAYPASFDEVVSVGGIFDDADGYLTYAIPKQFNIEYSGHRVIESVYMEYTEYPYEHRKNPKERPVGSTYNEKLDFVAPMFDIEILKPNQDGNQPGTDDVNVTWADGTSFSAPMTAGVSALVFHAYYKKFSIEPRPSIIYEALKQTAELDPTNPDTTPKPKINGKVYNVLQRSNRVGWGCVDAYDAILYILKELKK